MATNGGDHALERFLVSPTQEPALSMPQIVDLLRKRVKYVFVLYQENRSFDSYFGTFPGADGIYSQSATQTPGFSQPLINTDGTISLLHPFRIGPQQFAADLDDVDHTHTRIDAKMHVVQGRARMDHFALAEEARHMQSAHPSLQAKQFGELTMAYEDCDTVPFLWRYANRFTLYDHIFQLMTGPSTPGNLSIIAAQTGQTQEMLHPHERYAGNGDTGPGEPVLNDSDPFWGSPADTTKRGRQPVNPSDFPGYGIQRNQTYATLPITLAGKEAESQTEEDRDKPGDLSDIKGDLAFLKTTGHHMIPWGWYEEGYSKEPTDPNLGPIDASGTHASYITHHNSPQYFGYIANNPQLSRNLHGLQDFFNAVHQQTLPTTGGVFFVKGGFQNIFHLKPADPDPRAQKTYLGDDDHPGYSDAQMSEALIAQEINAIAQSRYWPQSAIIVTWDDSEGDYDHVPPPIVSSGPDGSIISDGPRVPLLLISPYARAHAVIHDTGDHGSVVKFVDTLFGLTPLAELPDEQKGRALGKTEFGQSNLGPDDAITPAIGNLVSGFDPARLIGKAVPLPGSYAAIPDTLVETLPQTSGYGCKDIGVTPVDIARHIPDRIPSDFNPRPKTIPTQPIQREVGKG